MPLLVKNIVVLNNSCTTIPKICRQFKLEMVFGQWWSRCDIQIQHQSVWVASHYKLCILSALTLRLVALQMINNAKSIKTCRVNVRVILAKNGSASAVSSNNVLAWEVQKWWSSISHQHEIWIPLFVNFLRKIQAKNKYSRDFLLHKLLFKFGRIENPKTLGVATICVSWALSQRSWIRIYVFRERSNMYLCIQCVCAGL